MKILYWFFLLILIIGWVAHWLYGMFDFSLFSYLPDTMIFNKISRADFVRVLIGISAIIVLLANFSISFSMRTRDE